jgi:hypothetical protein
MLNSAISILNHSKRSHVVRRTMGIPTLRKKREGKIFTTETRRHGGSRAKRGLTRMWRRNYRCEKNQMWCREWREIPPSGEIRGTAATCGICKILPAIL